MRTPHPPAPRPHPQNVEYVEDRDKTPALMKHLNGIQDGLILVFVETKRAADHLEFDLGKEGYPATSIHGDRTQVCRGAASAGRAAAALSSAQCQHREDPSLARLCVLCAALGRIPRQTVCVLCTA